ncbi:MAG: hypothetical protein ABI083_07140 [Lapillicoccus sp.]
MPAKTETVSPTSTFALPSFEEATESIKDLNEKWMESSKHAGLVTLDAYEKAVSSFVDFEKKVASDSDVEWVSTLATSHAKAISDMTTSYTKAVRDLLK